jgi:hypothetical protein
MRMPKMIPNVEIVDVFLSLLVEGVSKERLHEQASTSNDHVAIEIAWGSLNPLPCHIEAGEDCRRCGGGMIGPDGRRCDSCLMMD